MKIHLLRVPLTLLAVASLGVAQTGAPRTSNPRRGSGKRPVHRLTQRDCVGDACRAVQLTITGETCYPFPAENPGYHMYVYNSDSTRSVHLQVTQHATTAGGPPRRDEIVFPLADAPPMGRVEVGCTQEYRPISPRTQTFSYTYTIDKAEFVPITIPPPPPPTHDPLSDAECGRSDLPPNLPPRSNHGVYMLRLAAPAPNDNACLSFNLNPDNAEDVPIAACNIEQKKLFTLIPSWNGCYFIRNGNMRVPPQTGRCLFVENENSEELRAKACNPTSQEYWKLYRFPSDGMYNLINQRSGKCLDRDSGGADNAHMVACNGSQWQKWELKFIRSNKRGKSVKHRPVRHR